MINIEDIESKSSNTIDQEIIKLTESDQKIVATFCFKTCLYRKLHTLFTESELLSITQNVFTDLTIRDFVLDMTDKFSIKLNLGSGSNFEFEQYLANCISHFESRDTFVAKETLMPTHVFDNICVSKEDIVTTLTHNKWLVTIVLINLYFLSSSFFKEQPEAINIK